jgi:hypothetical protein
VEYQSYLNNLNPQNGSLWRATNNLTKTRENIPPLQLTDGTYSITDKQKANTFANQLHEIFKPHQDIVNNNTHLNDIYNFLDSPLPMSLPAKPISPGKIEYTLKKLPACKFPGNDLITNKILKNLPKKCIVYLTYIYNEMLRLSYFPSI